MTRPEHSPKPSARARLGGWLQQEAAALFACAAAVAWFYYLGYGPTLWPTRIDWMYRDDWAAYLWGWLFFRNADWAFPLGSIPGLFWPYGTSVGFTDANPWAALLFKLFSPVLPLEFQFSGMWFLLCFVLQGYFGARITQCFTADKIKQALGGTLFALTPLLPSRHPHIALSGFFFITAGIYLNVKPLSTRLDAKAALGVALAMNVWVAGTHGYLSVMLLTLTLALALRVWSLKLISLGQALASMAAFVLATAAVYWMFGLIGWKEADLTAEGFGQFSGDLTALFNPQGWSRWVPTLQYRPRQWEGFSYLGLGVLALLLARLALSLMEPRKSWQQLRQSWPLVLVLFLMWFYSLSSIIAYLGEEQLNLSQYYAHLGKLTGIFRSSGRFSWPLHLTLVALGISAACALRQRWLGRGLLLAAVLLQAAEMVPNRFGFPAISIAKLSHPAWESVSQHYRHLQTLPLYLQWVCRFDHHLVNRLSYEAYRRQLTMNSGNFMRKEPNPERLCEQHLARDAGIDAETVYVVDPRYVSDFRGKAAACGWVDELVVCVSEGKASPLLEAVRERRVL